MKCPSEMLQNLPYFIYTKTQSCFVHFSFRATLFFPLMNALVYLTRALIREKNKVALGFHIYNYKICQILKHFARAFHQA